MNGSTIPEIWWDEVDECYRVSFGGDYHKVMNCKDAIKAAIEDADRKWDPEDSSWMVYGEENIERVKVILLRYYPQYIELRA